MSGAGDLATIIGEQFEHQRGNDCNVCSDVKRAAAAVEAMGYRRPKVLGYLVVDRGGIMVGHQHKHRESAQAFADEWTADCKTAGIDWDYRVAEITEAAS